MIRLAIFAFFSHWTKLMTNTLTGSWPSIANHTIGGVLLGVALRVMMKISGYPRTTIDHVTALYFTGAVAVGIGDVLGYLVDPLGKDRR